ncbi:hypothetical protein Ae201684_000940 [Aphanomyces euteiches]|uniref:Coiled-coil SMC6 And NSE5 INteracting (CANIN) domain-containing protein n=1 Tax=Aphanomyces euteiches TaxID=100861 RepID=A0A6G0XVE8_9STRA|nr:hypothetical protein Ae201684_000940 [Aphanomyces euteiches]KAH9140104.1 hypothetical protein AeRB84_015631 [Aphanomyces euteiches]
MRRSSRVQASRATRDQPDSREDSKPSSTSTPTLIKNDKTPQTPEAKNATAPTKRKGQTLIQQRKQVAFQSPAKETPTKTLSTPQKGGTKSPSRFSLGLTQDDSEVDDIMNQLEEALPKQKKRKKARKSIDMFDDLDALLAENNKEQEKKKERADKIAQLRQESKELKELGCSLRQLSSEIETNMKDLQADDHLFDTEVVVEVEKFGYVFEPLTEPLTCPDFIPSKQDLNSPFKLVYECLATTNETQLASLLWSQAILVLAVEIKERVPSVICRWLFSLVSSHRNSHIVQGAFMNLFTLLLAGKSNVSQLTCGLPCGMLCRGIALPVKMDWDVSFNDFFICFRKYGFKESKRALNSKSKAQGHGSSSVWKIPFPSVNMEHVTMLFILGLRTDKLKTSDYDICTCCIFFLRMQFEDVLRPQLRELCSYCLEVLLDAFTPKLWRQQYAPLLILRIAGINEGFFQSAAGWLSIARRLPRTERGTQLTTGLAVYILQHRLDSSEESPIASSDEPLKFPLHCDLVLDIISTSVDSLIAKYSDSDAREVVPPYDLISNKIALMDLALQAFLNYLEPRDMSLILEKLDRLALTNKAVQAVQWHEMKTLVSLMHRKYSPENLRIGRMPSPKAKVVLFIDD